MGNLDFHLSFWKQRRVSLFGCNNRRNAAAHWDQPPASALASALASAPASVPTAQREVEKKGSPFELQGLPV